MRRALLSFGMLWLDNLYQTSQTLTHDARVQFKHPEQKHSLVQWDADSWVEPVNGADESISTKSGIMGGFTIARIIGWQHQTASWAAANSVKATRADPHEFADRGGRTGSMTFNRGGRRPHQ